MKSTQLKSILAFLCLLTSGLFTALTAQTGLTNLSDTSYFMAGEDDWNLVEAVLRKKPAHILHLLKRGADPNAAAEGGMTALQYAAESGDSTSVKLLVLNGADIELSPVENTSPLQVAVLSGHFTICHFLLKKGADPDHLDAHGASALHYASAMNNYAIADLLLFYGANDSLKDRLGNDALMTAVYFGNLETADVLLQNGLGPDSRDSLRSTPLMIAAQQGNKEMIDLLLDYGANPEAVNNQNLTPLSQAVFHGRDEAVSMLLKKGASPGHQVTGKCNLYDLARQRGNKDIADTLKARGIGPSPSPDFSVIEFTWGNSFGGKEHLMQFRLAWVDSKHGYFIESGFDFRPTPRTVQVEISEDLIHQYREHRRGWTLGLGKNFLLYADQQGLSYGTFLALNGFLSFPRYRGIADGPGPNYTIMPEAGIYLRGNLAGLKASLSPYQFGTLHEPWLKWNLGLIFRIPYKQARYEEKEIFY